MGWIAEALFPKRCLGCGRGGKYICDRCQVGIWEEEQICPECGRGSRYGVCHEYCRKSGSLAGLTCLWAFDGLARKLISRAKYKYYFDTLTELVDPERVNNRVELEFFHRFIAKDPAVIPVPLHVSRQRMRGFNQAEIVGRRVAERFCLKFTEGLIRTRDTGRQVGRSRDERLEAVRGAFTVSKNTGRMENLLLVDDVWTTGATMRECSGTLRKAGVKRVWGLVLAR